MVDFTAKQVRNEMFLKTLRSGSVQGDYSIANKWLSKPKH